MNRPIIAAVALAAGIALAMPILATAADPDARSMPSASMPGGDGMRGEHHGMMARIMRRHMAEMTPQQRCEERLAHRAGVVAYTVAKVNMTAEQRPLWDKVQAQLQAAADKQRQLCASLGAAGERGQQTILDRLGR